MTRPVLLVALSVLFVLGLWGERREPDPGGPYFHDTWVARSPDGRTLVGARRVLEHASVPDVCVTADGRRLLYYVDGTRWDDDYPLAVRALDGSDAPGPELPLRIEGEDAAAVDPEALLLEDGRVRLYYVAGSEIHSAVSRDGLAFVREPGFRLAGEGVVDPAVVRGAEWRMYYALLEGPCVKSARSGDGLAFVEDPGVRVAGAGSPGALALPDGRVRLLVGGRALVSRDGLGFVEEGAAGLEVLDPSVVALPGGGYLVAFKRFRRPGR